MLRKNKGFSLVELIIVIAIMAILAGAIAPALIKYIDKSKKSNDISSAKLIESAIEVAIGSQVIYEGLVPDTVGTTYIAFRPGGVCSAEMSGSSALNIKILGDAPCLGENSFGANETECIKEIGSAIGEKIPKVRYRKKGMKTYVAELNESGKVKVGLIDKNYDEYTIGEQPIVYLSPEVDEDYQ